MCRQSRSPGFIESANRHNAHEPADNFIFNANLNMEANPHETAADANYNSLPACFVCQKQIVDNQWFCRLTQKVNEAATQQATKILLCSPACALRHFTTPNTQQS